MAGEEPAFGTAADESPTTHLGAEPPPAGQFDGGPPPPPPPPPPGGSGAGWADEPPPITGFARRHQLIRPVQGKKVAGVCAGIGRATGTDPVLWRVILTVLVFFGGVGLLAYVVGWLCMPREDDQVAPVESLVGRGRSATSPVLTVLLGVIGIGLVFFVFNSGFRAMVLMMGVAVVVAVVLTRRNQERPTDGDPAAPGSAAPSGATAPSGADRPTPDPAMAAAPAATGAPPTAAGYRVTPNYTVPPTTAQQPGYRPPFAPHGPYGPRTASPLGAGEVPIGGMLPPPPPPPQYRGKPPKPPKQKSILGRLTFFVLCLAIGALAVLAAAGLHVPASAFFALGLVVLGGGLVFGAWRGRARWLIILGCVFALALPIAWVSENAHWEGPSRSREFSPGDHVWVPRSVQGLRPDYTGSVGDATLDLSNVDFAGQHEAVSVHNSVGDVKVLLPPNVDVTVTLEPGLGDATLFGQPVDSPHNKTQERTDLGPDGRGGGILDLRIKDNAGDVEVTR
ncbi:PspC domain-containing protein [Actinocatenispora thailandica]|uniref:PspC domain-containing protein n=1 Tax=Actinocatenispora thailandica TaxID=227318 RepID=UPI0019514E00|nr:PspC domain-containing protein [Actinocatenispora thailandica]